MPNPIKPHATIPYPDLPKPATKVSRLKKLKIPEPRARLSKPESQKPTIHEAFAEMPEILPETPKTPPETSSKPQQSKNPLPKIGNKGTQIEEEPKVIDKGEYLSENTSVDDYA
jgi:hypothetical protein